MKKFKKDGKVIYFAINENSAIHFVPNVNWTTYLAVRKNVPLQCRMYPTIETAEDAATDYEGFFRHFPDTYAAMHNLEKPIPQKHAATESVFAPKTQKSYFELLQENEELRKEIAELKKPEHDDVPLEAGGSLSLALIDDLGMRRW